MAENIWTANLWPAPGSAELDSSDSSPKDIVVQGVKILETDLGTSFVWAGQEYPCAGGAEFGGKKIDDGGFRLFADLKIKVRVELFTGNLPQEKQTILYKRSPDATGKAYRISSITNFWGAVLEIECVDPNQGA